MLQSYEGGCHCGRVRFRIQVDLADTVIGECNCSICTKKGILHLPVLGERLEILSGADEMTTYTFGTGVAKHTFCRHCGIHAFYQPRSDPENTASTPAASTITTRQRCRRAGSSTAATGRRPSPAAPANGTRSVSGIRAPFFQAPTPTLPRLRGRGFCGAHRQFPPLLAGEGWGGGCCLNHQ